MPAGCWEWGWRPVILALADDLVEDASWVTLRTHGGRDEPEATSDHPESPVNALLDATERLMLSDGYAAVTSRRVAAEAGVNPGLVYYYFGPMDNLFIEVFRRSAARMLDRQAEALASEQPLWALWDLIRDQTNTGLNLEFLALGNHRKPFRLRSRTSRCGSAACSSTAMSKVLTSTGSTPSSGRPKR